jgi:hypothetical protein
LTLKNGAILDFQVGTSKDLINITGGTFTGVASGSKVYIKLSDAGGLAIGEPYTVIDWPDGAAVEVEAADFAIHPESAIRAQILIPDGESRLTVTVPPKGSVFMMY